MQRVVQVEEEVRCLLAVDVLGRESDVLDGHIFGRTTKDRNSVQCRTVCVRL
jgi:hypothetical protein